MSTQYTALGFKPSDYMSPPLTTRPGLLPMEDYLRCHSVSGYIVIHLVYALGIQVFYTLWLQKLKADFGELDKFALDKIRALFSMLQYLGRAWSRRMGSLSPTWYPFSRIYVGKATSTFWSALDLI